MLPSAEDVADVVVDTIKASLGSVTARIEALERRSLDSFLERIAVLEHRLAEVDRREPIHGRDGKDGRDGERGLQGDPGRDGLIGAVGQVGQMGPMGERGIAGEIGPAGPAGANGKDAEVDLDALAVRAAELIPRPKDGAPGKDGNDGASVTVEDLAGVVSAEVIKAVAALPPAKAGKDGQDGAAVDASAVEALVAAHVTRAVAALPPPKDGASVTVDDVRPLVASTVADAVRALPVAKDGVGLASMLIDREGHLVLMLSNGETKDVGLVTGKDVDMVAVASIIRDEIAAMPRPKDGRDGVDGLGIDDLEVVHDGERTFTLRWSKGERVVEKSFTVPTVIYRGTYADGKTYEAWDSVTRGGCMWIARARTSAVPGTEDVKNPARAWVQSTKEGREGKIGPVGPKGIDGKDGTNGRDLTSMTQDGTKYR